MTVAFDSIFGHTVYLDDDDPELEWRWLDTGEATPQPSYENGRCARHGRQCPKCGMTDTGAEDPCIGRLSNVRFACCGHGDIEKAYVAFENGTQRRQQDALDYFDLLAKNEK